MPPDADSRISRALSRFPGAREGRPPVSPPAAAAAAAATAAAARNSDGALLKPHDLVARSTPNLSPSSPLAATSQHPARQLPLVLLPATAPVQSALSLQGGRRVLPLATVGAGLAATTAAPAPPVVLDTAAAAKPAVAAEVNAAVAEILHQGLHPHLTQQLLSHHTFIAGHKSASGPWSPPPPFLSLIGSD